jgi:prepilin-type N-terminal cleavage/methylation domain-containing protein
MKREDGFTLIEVLVSFVILSGAIIFSFETYANGLRGLHQAQDSLNAQALSQSILSRVLTDDSVVVGSKGAAGQMTWELVVRPIRQGNNSLQTPVVIEVHVFDREGREITTAALSTIKIARVAVP